MKRQFKASIFGCFFVVCLSTLCPPLKFKIMDYPSGKIFWLQSATSSLNLNSRGYIKLTNTVISEWDFWGFRIPMVNTVWKRSKTNFSIFTVCEKMVDVKILKFREHRVHILFIEKFCEQKCIVFFVWLSVEKMLLTATRPLMKAWMCWKRIFFSCYKTG